MTDNVIDTPTFPSTTDREHAVDALLSAAVLAADRRREAQAQREAERDAVIEREEREEREKMAERLTEILTGWTLAVPELTADNISEAGWEILPELYLAPNGPNIRVYNVAEGTRIVASLADLGDAIRAHQAKQARDAELEIAEREMEAKKPPFPTLPSVIPGSRIGTGVIFEPHGRFLTLRPFAPRDGGAGVAFAVEYISSAEARRLADAKSYRSVRVGDYLAAITPDAMTWLDDDGRTIPVPLVANWSSLCAALRSWADYADALDAWEAERRKRGLTDY